MRYKRGALYLMCIGLHRRYNIFECCVVLTKTEKETTRSITGKFEPDILPSHPPNPSEKKTKKSQVAMRQKKFEVPPSGRGSCKTLYGTRMLKSRSRGRRVVSIVCLFKKA